MTKIIIASPIHPQAQAAMAKATAIRSYGFSAGTAYCDKQGINPPAKLVRLARQLEAAKRHGI